MADGKTVEEAIDNTKHIISDWIETAEKLGRDIPSEDFDSFQSTSPTVFDVAKYVLQQCGKMTTMALEKMVYYCKVWSLAWYQKPLFDDSFQAWAHGPVCKSLFDVHKGQFVISEDSIESSHNFSIGEISLMDAVIGVYRQFDAESLSDFTHFELPWQNARGGLETDEKGNVIISDQSIIQYYGKAAK